MGGERERLVLVTDFSQLRAGDLIVITPCGHCDGSHRGLLIGWDDHPDGVLPDGSSCCDPGWVCTATCGGDELSIDAECVSDGLIYRVDTGLSHTTETEKELEVTR